MDFTQSALFLDVARVIREAKEPLGVDVEATIHITSNVAIKPMKFISRDVYQDFIHNFGDMIFIKVLVSGSDYATKIYPNRGSLYITLKDVLTGFQSGGVLTGVYSQSERYKAVLIDENGNAVLESSARSPADPAQMDLNGFVEVSFQLLTEALHQLRMTAVGRTFHRTTGAAVIQTLFGDAFAGLLIDDAIRPFGVDVYPIDNKTVYEQLLIPHGTLLTEVPDLLQNKLCGLYNSGLGNYYLRRHWRIFPLYNTDRQEDVDESLTIINVPESIMPGIEKTYIRHGRHTTILATGSIKLDDDAETQQLNSGNALRFANADQFMETRHKVENNKLMYKRNKNITEAVTSQRSDRLNFAPVTQTKITANALAEYSKMARRDGLMVTLLWEHANPNLLKPGMVVKLMYLDKNKIRTLNGTLLGTQQYTHSPEKIMFGGKFRTNVGLAIFFNRKDAYL